MQELTLRDIQSISMDILQDVHTFCINNDIHYSLAFGTLLGAIRHQGFIPWDDDIDIMMPRPEYEKFCRSYSSEHFHLICPGNDKSCMIAFARVCDMEKTTVTGTTWTNQETGIWIDIFPIDGVENDFSKFELRCKRERKKWLRLLQNREIAGGPLPHYSKKMKLLIKAVNRFHLSFLNEAILRIRRDSITRDAMSISFGSTGYACECVCYEDEGKVPYPADVFNNYISAPFGDKQFMIVERYDKVLEANYGNYMELPPVEQRVPKQDYLKFCWKHGE